MTKYTPPEYIADRYRIIGHLGKGGMASVYRATDEVLDRDVAIKFLSLEHLDGRNSTDRFLREARTVARLSHPNIMTLYDMGQQEEWHYLVLEYIPGTSLYKMMKDQGTPIPLDEAVSIITDTLKALEYAHEQGLIHRDIKPDNIMITPDGQIKVADFGLALTTGDTRLTNTDAVVGTALYIAPEIINAGEIDHRADLYSIGGVFYELLAGKPPYTGESSLQILNQALNTPLTPPSLINSAIPKNIEAIVIKLLEKDPNDRYDTASEVLAALPDISEMEALVEDVIKRTTSERLSRTLLERIVRPLDDEEDSLLAESTKDKYPIAQDLLVYAAQGDINEAIEMERRRMANLLEEQIINELDVVLSQVKAYEQTLYGNKQAKMALSVLSSLVRQTLQQARDLEGALRPAILETLGLEPALETLSNQILRVHGVHIALSLQRMRERLPGHIELGLFRATQEVVDLRRATSSRITIRLERREDALFFSIEDNGIPPTEDILHSTRRHIEGIGGVMEIGHSVDDGLQLIIRFAVEANIDLTEREMDVIQLLADGLSNKEIAVLLHISPRTVKFHLDNIYSKLNVNSRTEAAVYALRRGWVRRHPAHIGRS